MRNGPWRPARGPRRRAVPGAGCRRSAAPVRRAGRDRGLCDTIGRLPDRFPGCRLRHRLGRRAHDAVSRRRGLGRSDHRRDRRALRLRHHRDCLHDRRFGPGRFPWRCLVLPAGGRCEDGDRRACHAKPVQDAAGLASVTRLRLPPAAQSRSPLPPQWRQGPCPCAARGRAGRRGSRPTLRSDGHAPARHHRD